MSNKQSSIERLAELIRLTNKELYAEMFEKIEQAKAMHKEEVTQAHNTGYIIGGGNGELYEPEKYYNETFK